MKSKLIVLLCFAVMFATGIDAQNDSKAILRDEHSSLPCDDLIGRLDMFFYELSKDASSTGLVVISTSNEKKWWAVFREYLIDAHARDRNFKPNRIKYVRTIESDEFMVQLWQIPLGVAEPAVQNVDITYKLPPVIKPFRLGVEYPYADGICPEVEDFPIFAQFMNGNPGSRGNIVVRDRTVERARRRAEKIRRDFLRQYGIPSSRLRFFPRSVLPSELLREPIVEYWYLP